MKKKEKKIEDWEEEFDEKFTNLPYSDSWNVAEDYNPSDVKFFITRLLENERERILSRVKSEIQKPANYMDKETLIKVIEAKLKL